GGALRRAAADPAGGAREPGRRARPGHRADDGGRGADRAARGGAVRGAPAPLPLRPARRGGEGVSGAPAALAFALGFAAGTAAAAGTGAAAGTAAAAETTAAAEAAAPGLPPPVVLDDFEREGDATDPAPWTVATPEDATLALAREVTPEGAA